MTRYQCPRCGYVQKTAIKPEFIKTPPTCAGTVPGLMQHIKPAKMELQDD